MLSLERREDLRRNMPSKNKKSPMAFRPPGELKIGLCGRAPAETGSKHSDHPGPEQTTRSEAPQVSNGLSAWLGKPDEFLPIKRIRPAPGKLRLVQPIAGTNEVIRGDQVVGGIRHYAAPSVAFRTYFRRPHRP
jgi:hypothetical protein